jgi:hypothetical protein
MLRACGSLYVVAVYTGNRLDSLSSVFTRRARGNDAQSEASCGGVAGVSVRLNAAAGEIYRIAVTAPGDFQLLVGTQLASLAGTRPALLYTAFPGQNDNLKLRLTGVGPERALLVEAEGVGVANGCQADVLPGRLRCPVPGRTAIALDADLGGGNDSADVQLLAPGRQPDEEPVVRRVLGGDGNDTLAGSAGAYGFDTGWVGRLSLIGGRGNDSILGGRGSDSVRGGPGADRIDPGGGTDAARGGSGADRLRSVDGSTDRIGCDAGRDHARLDGIDLPAQECERRRLASPPRAVPVSAVYSNDTGDDDDHLVISIGCPLDVERGCATKIRVAVKPDRTITRRLRLRPGRSGIVQTYTFSERFLRRGVRVTATTRRRRGATLKFTRRLPVFDDRYYGE